MVRTKAAATWRWPARTKIGSVRIGTVERPPCSRPRSATPSPPMEMSTSWKPVPWPKSVWISISYSPSTGKSWVTTIPPRVPYGAPSR